MSAPLVPAGGVDDATEAQRRAADPAASAWVSANAGSGKTKVLTDRVARLLLTGVQPQRILCLTFTKAAAAEMQNRLFDRLGTWAMMPDAELVPAMEALGAPDIDRAILLRRARTLFGRAIETPGGLKIQTIHSLCASLLRRFPLEAGVSPAFEEMDERQAEEMAERVLDAMAREPEGAEAIGGAARLTGGPMRELALEVAKGRDRFEEAPEVPLDAWLGLEGAPEDLSATLLEGGEADLVRAAIPFFDAGSKTDMADADKLRAAPPFGPEGVLGWIDLLTYGPETKRPGAPKLDRFPTKGTRGKPGFPLAEWDAFKERAAEVAALARARTVARNAHALRRFAKAFLAGWDAAKLRAGLLDFDDLIRRTRALMRGPAAAWVLYRMDGGIDHVLVDEAQDTAPMQWDVIEALTEEFTAGEGARSGGEGGRSLFVVGDPKQSIYGFQGAEPGGFEARADAFERRFAAAGKPFRRVELLHSFRSSDAVLGAVDAVLSGAPGVGETRHLAFREAMPGRVDIWPAVEPAEAASPESFRDPIDALPEDAADVRLAAKVVEGVERMIREGAPVATKGAVRPVRPGDVLILLRSRGVLFQEIIRGLKQRDARTGGLLPVAGADRLRVLEELAVRDLVSLLAFLSLEEDDLALAEVLRSPLCGLSEGHLFALAHARPGTLWEALRRAEGRHGEVVAMLRDLRAQTGFLRPFELLERALVRHGGRRRLVARLGREAEEGIDALLGLALDYEARAVPSLTGFVSWVREDASEIKRVMDEGGGAIRVMTVHGAKGLEAPVVIVPQTAKPVSRAAPQAPEVLATPAGPIWRGSKAVAPAPVRALIEASVEEGWEEHRRLLYVAMTRAESWLIVAGAGEMKDRDLAWFAAVEDRLEDRAERIETPTGTGLRVERGRMEAAGPGPEAPAIPAPPDGWSLPALSGARTDPGPVSPSGLGGAKTLPGEAADPGALARGTHLHLLLEHLPRHPGLPDMEVARDLLLAAEPPAREEDLPLLVAEARTVLDAPRLAPLFAPGTRAEVTLAGDLPGLGPALGAVDRIVPGEGEVLIVDYKSNRLPAAAPEAVPEGLLRQLGAYAALAAPVFPSRKVRTAILWTADATLTEVPPALREAALARAAAEMRGAD
ncbi:DNA helicase/exodeoxyribonuclease V subunit A [Hasllibacter halocynthiae]|uniref:DNA 3'-5' helicase n=1 Tax=Hasllibacter halocynthiae TaxID=595589 RepID=A0A2T0X2T0_9RHOB|nr:double-strand break repair helicase AddA [Hasllibacter halocynthiae]PRY93164.1 DNA helicase/exodeoxyribonuclease V subunit A [Hasllibacter halocynthiae]